MPAPSSRGLTAAELGLAVAELRTLCPTTVRDAACLLGTGGHEDLLLVLQADATAAKVFVHIALGGTRARVTTTSRRFGRERRASGPAADALARDLRDAVLRELLHPADERRCTFVFAGPAGDRRLEVELFGARGLWALCAGDGTILTMSRAIATAVRTLHRGDRYRPPPPAPARTSPNPACVRFAAPVLAAIDGHFTALDKQQERADSEGAVRLAAERAQRRARHKADGLRRQLSDPERGDRLRRTADLMLAYAHDVPRGARSMEVPAIDGDGTTTIDLDPKRPVAAQANALYDKARRLDDGREVTARRLSEADAELAELEAILTLLRAADDDRIERARARLQALGVLPQTPAGKAGHKRNDVKVPFRRYTSAEGYPLFVGRNNRQNDQLTMRYANGNDLWLHVGGGRAGSHVVVRLPKNKTASLETLLDAATLAVHFSKARGEPRIDVIYTQRKHIRKPKGLPPGAVVPSQTRTVTVAHDPQRLRRLLDGAVND
ncbi:MAG TPA: DUF814 domain-containing protein [bacterium]|nr:DUF814 domain-containing protein [bacterium]